MHCSVHTIDALVIFEPLGLSVMAHVSAVTLSPRSAIFLPDHPSITCPITAIIAPINSDKFWFEESTPNSKNLRSMALTPTTSSAPSLLTNQITLTHLAKSRTRLEAPGCPAQTTRYSE
jgi:hypothetical protein